MHNTWKHQTLLISQAVTGQFLKQVHHLKAFTVHFNNLHVFPVVHYSSINIYSMSSCLPNPVSDLSCYSGSQRTSKQVVHLLCNKEQRAFEL